MLTAQSYICAINKNTSEALAITRQAEEHARNISVDLQIPWIRIFAGQSLLLNGEAGMARELLQAGTTLADEQGSPFWSVIGRLWIQTDKLESAPTDENIEALKSVMQQVEAIGAKLSLPHAQSSVARAYRKTGRIGEARKLATLAVQEIARTGERLWAPYIQEEYSKICKAGAPDAKKRAEGV